MKMLRGRRALITGAGAGIGRATALALAREGVDVWLVDLQREALESVAQHVDSAGVRGQAHVCDLREVNAIAACVDEMRSAWGGLDLLVNNAGIVFAGPTHDMTRDQWRELMAVNLHAPIELIHHALPIMREAGEGHIVNISSLAGLVGFRRYAAYQTSKFGLVGLSLSLRAEYAEEHIGVSVICPGVVKSELFRTAKQRGWFQRGRRPLERFAISCDTVARAVVRSIRRNRALTVLPLGARVLWRMERLWPGWYTRVRGM